MANQFLGVGGVEYDTEEAKALSLDENGHLKNREVYIMDDHTSSVGRDVQPGETWTSDIFETGGLKDLYWSTTLNDTGLYELTLVEYVWKTISQTANQPREKKVLVPPETVWGSWNGKIRVDSPRFRVEFKNNSDKVLRVGMYLYLK